MTMLARYIDWYLSPLPPRTKARTCSVQVPLFGDMFTTNQGWTADGARRAILIHAASGCRLKSRAR